jgi:cyclopropane fatty-acyl-phospholipid synthase-like methyltransferase
MLSDSEVAQLDPYAFFAVLGKRVIHPGGRTATDELIRRAEFRADQRVLDVGCGVGSTAIRIARHFGPTVTAVDIAPLMLDRASANVSSARMDDRIAVEHGDICNLRFVDGSFDRVVAEAVTMFVDRPRAVRELVRVCTPGGRVLATEFYWRKPPTPEARYLFLDVVCPGMQFDTLEDWVRLYTAAGLADVQVETGPFDMMTPSGFLHDEGLVNSAAVMARALSRRSYARKMAWLMPRVARAVPYLGFILVSGTKPPADVNGET